MLGGEHVRQLIHVLFDKRFEIEHHARAALRIGARPLRERRQRGFNRVAHFGAGCERDFCLHFAGGGIEDIAETAGSSGDMFSGDEM